MSPAAPRVPPTVRLIFACESLQSRPPDITVLNPQTHFQLPAGGTFPFQTAALAVYLQLAEGLGTFDVAVELWRIANDGSRRYVGMSPIVRGLAFGGATRMVPQQHGVHLRNVRFRSAGVYEIRAVEVTADRSTPLAGLTGLLRVGT